MILRSLYVLCMAACVTGMACAAAPKPEANNNASGSPLPAAAVSPAPTPAEQIAKNAQPLTLPVLDAFFADQSFSDVLRSRLQLTDEQVTKLRELAHGETAKLNEANAGQTEGETADARSAAQEKVSALIGQDKAAQLAALVRERWNEASEPGTAAPTEKSAAPTTNPIPTSNVGRQVCRRRN